MSAHSEAIKERLEAGKYSSIVNVNRAMGQKKISKKERKEILALAESKFPNATSSTGTRKTQRKAQRKRGKDGRVLNGAGDSRAVSMVKLMHHPDAWDALMQLHAKTIDENLTLHELHDEMKELSKMKTVR